MSTNKTPSVTKKPSAADTPVARIHAHKEGKVELSSRELRYCRPWDLVFQNNDFLGLAFTQGVVSMLVGKSLESLCAEVDLPEDEKHYIAFLSLDWSGDLFWTLSPDGSADRADLVRKSLRLVFGPAISYGVTHLRTLPKFIFVLH